MVKIAYILLCHKDPDAVIRQAADLTAAGDYVAIHFDANAKPGHYTTLRKVLTLNPNVTFAKKRVKCGWGEWSLVQATLNTLESAVQTFADATHFYLLSADCMAIKSAQYAHRFLDENDADFIESFDYFESDWIKTGMKKERLIYRHYFNERRSKRLFYGSMALQQKLGLYRKLPPDIDFKIGSQWWCLRRQTIEAVLKFIRKRRDLMRLFSTTWIPDETFFQTIVSHIVPSNEIRGRTLTFLRFSDYGVPVNFYNDQYDMLIAQDCFFARKISPEANDLKRRLGSLYATSDVSFNIANEGPKLHKFLTQRGRIGRRFGLRFWEAADVLGPDHHLLIVLCKKKRVAKRLLEHIGQACGFSTVGYLFSDENTPLPDLGGIQAPLQKRTRHRRALVRMLFERFETDRLVICVDPEDSGCLTDFMSAPLNIRVLEIDCHQSDNDLTRHAMDAGLAHEQTPPEALNALLRTMRNDMTLAAEHIRNAGFAHHTRLREDAGTDENAAALERFLTVPQSVALEIANSDTLFSD